MYITMETNELSYARRTHKRIFRPCQEEYRIDIGFQMADHISFILLVFQVFNGTHTAHDDMRVVLLHIIGNETGKRVAPDIFQMALRLAQKAHAFLDRKERLFIHIVEHADDDLIEHRAGPCKNIDMTSRHGVKAA